MSVSFLQYIARIVATAFCLVALYSTSVFADEVKSEAKDKLPSPAASGGLDKIYNSLEQEEKIKPVKKGPPPDRRLVIPVEKMQELDFKTKNEILAMRTAAVEKHFDAFRSFYWRVPTSEVSEHDLFQENAKQEMSSDAPYFPSDDVFKYIESKRPWWGILGISYYGAGYKSIAGQSEESRYLLNPYLFVGIAESKIRAVHGRSLPPRPIYPKVTKLVFNFTKNTGIVHYDVTSYRKTATVYGYTNVEMPEFRLVAYNARDFLMNYISIDTDKSQNVAFPEDSTLPHAIGQYLGLGHSCDFPDGCNNMISEGPPDNIMIRKLPAVLHVKLWRDRPTEIEAKPDMNFRIFFR